MIFPKYYTDQLTEIFLKKINLNQLDQNEESIASHDDEVGQEEGEDGEPMNDIDGEPMDDIDGEPLEDVDGEPLEDMDGEPLQEDPVEPYTPVNDMFSH